MTAPAQPTRLPADLPTTLVCAGCGYTAPGDEPAPLACPRRAVGDDVDHVVTRRLDPARVAFPRGAEANPFVRYRTLFHAYHVGRALGWSDAEYVGRVERLDAEIARVDGRGFRMTPFDRRDALSERLGFSAVGGVLVKDETGNVSGSHKARHLAGTLLELEAAEAPGRARSGRGAPATGTRSGGTPPLAIASCGNAALAAAVVARAAGRALDVFIPTQAEPAVVARLRDLGARLTVCERELGVAGDPTYIRLLRALADGAVAFTCQGNLNGLAIEGGETLGYEMAAQLAEAGGHLDRVFVQVGGGALASAVAQAFAEARALGAIDGLPRFHGVQTRGGYPLARAYDLVAGHLADRLGVATIGVPLELADSAVADVLASAARHRSAFMWPWEEEPQSVATGILDDETYDWMAVVRGMLASGGSPVVVDEETLFEANELARSATGIDVDPTGSAGLAGLIELRRRGVVGPGETVAVLFTGITRRFEAPASGPAATAAGHHNRGGQR
jgi:threonine synthase